MLAGWARRWGTPAGRAAALLVFCTALALAPASNNWSARGGGAAATLDENALLARRDSPPPWPGEWLTALDGDTLLLPDGSRLRLDGIDTPETGRPLAAQATQAVVELLAGRRWRLIPESPSRDVYGRLLGDLRSEQGLELGNWLLSRGLAWVYRGNSPEQAALQAAAVSAEIGVHAGLDELQGPFVVTSNSFHRADCALVRRRGRELAWVASVRPLLKAGQAACRRCLRWPPRRAAVH